MQYFESIFSIFTQHSDGIFSALAILGITLLAVLLLRFFVLWYFRVNAALKFLEWQKDILAQHFDQNNEIIRLLKKVAGESATDAGNAGAGEAQVADMGLQIAAALARERAAAQPPPQAPQAPQAPPQAQPQQPMPWPPQAPTQVLPQVAPQMPPPQAPPQMQQQPAQQPQAQPQRPPQPPQQQAPQAPMQRPPQAPPQQQAPQAQPQRPLQQPLQQQTQWETRTCPSCGYKNDPMSMYCCSCFEKLG
jgi:hypothetical protein